MTDEERYLFDLNGYLVIPNAVAPAAVARMNAYMDTQLHLDAAGKGSIRGGNLLTWGPDFLALLDNPVVLPYLKELLGDTLRLDHDYAILMEAGGPGLVLHGGGTPYDPAQYYHCYNGRMYNGLTVVSYALTDIGPGQGGLAVVPGSHKANFRCPDSLRHIEADSAPNDLVRQVPMKAGDCAVFTEALTHGTFPWTGAHQRRSLFFKFSPGHLSWANRYYLNAESRLDDANALDAELTDAQRALLAPPGVYQRRPVPEK